MANRGQAFFRGLCSQNHNLTNLVRRSGRDAVVSTDCGNKRKRAKSDENLATVVENDLYSCLFDQNNRCTIFDLDEPSTATNVPAMEMELERFKLSPSASMAIPSEPPALIQLDTTITPAEMKITPLPVVIPRKEDATGSETEPKISDSEILSLFDPKIFLEDEPDAGITVPTMEMKSCRLSPSRANLQKESSALTQVSVASAPPINAVKFAPAPTQKNAYEMAPAMRPRNRPFKNVRERKRRREMKGKFMQLYNLCCSKVAASVLSQPGEATGLLIPISGSVPPLTLVNHEPSKVDVLGDAIQTFEALDKELSRLRARNRELKMNAATSRLRARNGELKMNAATSRLRIRTRNRGLNMNAAMYA